MSDPQLEKISSEPSVDIFQELFDISEISLVIYDIRDMQIKFLSPEFQKLMQQIGYTTSEFFNKIALKKIASLAISEGEKDTQLLQFKLDQGYVFLELSVYKSKKDPYNFILKLKNISEAVWEISELIENLPGHVILVDPDGNIRMAKSNTENGEQSLGSLKTGSNLFTVFSNMSLLIKKHFEQASNTNRPVLEVYAINEQYYAVWAIYVPRIGSYLAMAQNVTELLLSREVIESQQSELKKMQENLTRIEDDTNFLAHEIRTPLSQMMLNLSHLKTRLKERSIDPDGALVPIEKTIGSIKHVNLMITDLIESMKVERKIITSEVSEHNLKDLYISVTKSLSALFPNRQVNWTYENPMSEVLTVNVELIETIITNLLTNALKYSNGSVDASITVSQNSISIKVRDYGIGMTPEFIRDELFGKFKRSIEAKKTGAHGIGLGLYIIKKKIEELGGKIFVESKIGEGSTFEVLIPLVKNTV